MDFIITYAERWDTSLRTSKHHFTKRLAERGDRILYIEIPPNPLTILKRPAEFLENTLPKIRRGVMEVEKNIWIATGIFPFPYHRDLGGIFDKKIFNTMNQKYFLRRLKKLLKKLDFQCPYLIVYYPLIFPVIDEIEHDKIIFHMVDE